MSGRLIVHTGLGICDPNWFPHRNQLASGAASTLSHRINAAERECLLLSPLKCLRSGSPIESVEADYTLFGPLVLDEWDAVFLGAEAGNCEACVWPEGQIGSDRPGLYPLRFGVSKRFSSAHSNQHLAETVAAWAEKVRAVKGLADQIANRREGRTSPECALVCGTWPFLAHEWTRRIGIRTSWKCVGVADDVSTGSDLISSSPH